MSQLLIFGYRSFQHIVLFPLQIYIFKIVIRHTVLYFFFFAFNLCEKKINGCIFNWISSVFHLDILVVYNVCYYRDHDEHPCENLTALGYISGNGIAGSKGVNFFFFFLMAYGIYCQITIESWCWFFTSSNSEWEWPFPDLLTIPGTIFTIQKNLFQLFVWANNCVGAFLCSLSSFLWWCFYLFIYL